MATERERAELDAKARQGETVVPGGAGGKSLEAQVHLAEGREEPWWTDEEGAAGDRRVPGDGAKGWTEHHRGVGRGACGKVMDHYGLSLSAN